jgi:hypothetical protein
VLFRFSPARRGVSAQKKKKKVGKEHTLCCRKEAVNRLSHCEVPTLRRTSPTRPSARTANSRRAARSSPSTGRALNTAPADPAKGETSSADVMIARSRRWPHEAAELLRGVSDDYAASPPPRQSEQRFQVVSKAIAEPGSYTCTAQVPITDPTPAVPAHPDLATGEIFEDCSDADGEAEVATQPCGYRDNIARTCGDIIMFETPAGISGKWPRALPIEVSSTPRRYTEDETTRRHSSK